MGRVKKSHQKRRVGGEPMLKQYSGYIGLFKAEQTNQECITRFLSTDKLAFFNYLKANAATFMFQVEKTGKANYHFQYTFKLTEAKTKTSLIKIFQELIGHNVTVSITK